MFSSDVCIALWQFCMRFVCRVSSEDSCPATLTRATKLLLKYRPTYSLVTIPILSALHHLPTLQPTASTPTPTPPTHAGDWGKEGTQLGWFRALGLLWGTAVACLCLVLYLRTSCGGVRGHVLWCVVFT